MRYKKKVVELCFIKRSRYHFYFVTQTTLILQKKKRSLKLMSSKTTLILQKKTFSETDVIKMLEFLILVFAMFGGCDFQQTFGIPLGTNYRIHFHLATFQLHSFQSTTHKTKD